MGTGADVWHEERLSPELVRPLVGEAVGDCAFVLTDGTAMLHRGADRLEAAPGPGLSAALRRQFRLDTALCLPVRADDLDAWLIIPGRDEGSAEDFLVGAVASARISAAFQRAAAREALHRAAAAEDRLRLGRDLHDGILQSLAGAVLKLQAALRREEVPPALAADIAQLCDLLAAEQRELRGFITRLRPDAAAPASVEDTELAPELEHLVAALGVQ
jgi:signal transduction histidine kinase